MFALICPPVSWWKLLKSTPTPNGVRGAIDSIRRKRDATSSSITHSPAMCVLFEVLYMCAIDADTHTTVLSNLSDLLLTAIVSINYLTHSFVRCHSSGVIFPVMENLRHPCFNVVNQSSSSP